MYRRDGRLMLAATDLVGFLACGHLTELERAAAAGLVKAPIRDDPEIELLRRRGYQHEQRYIEHLEAQGRQITCLPEEDAGGNRLPLELRADQTEQALRRGDDVIFQATFFDGRWRGHADFLLRVEAPSALGPFSYEVADTKLAHSARASAILQICSYVEQLTRIQEVQPEHMHVVLGGAGLNEQRFRVDDYMAYYRTAKGRFEQAVDDAISGAPAYPPTRTYPDPVEHCYVCRWAQDCRTRWRTDDALPLVAGISRNQRVGLKNRGIGTRRSLGRLELPLTPPIDRTSAPALGRTREQARLQVESEDEGRLKHELLAPERVDPRDPESALVLNRGLGALPPPSHGDLFFDIEGDPFALEVGLDYLFGIREPSASDGTLWARDWHAIWALDRGQEKQAFEQVIDLFMDRLARDPNMHIYHYAPYEPTAMKRLAGRHGTREEEVDRLLRGGVFVDLYRVVRQGVRVGAESYSIKRLEPLYNFTRTVELRHATESIVEFERFLEEGGRNQQLLDQIELYNRDDCDSAWRLRDWLEDRRPDAEREFGVTLPRATPADPNPPQALGERILALQQLEARLTAGIPDDEAERTPAQHATWLLAQLLEWHRREEKSMWWRFYDLMTTSDGELLDAKEPLAGLEYVGIAGQSPRGLPIYRYRFPRQEHDVGPRSDLHDPQLQHPVSETGAFFALNEEAGTIDIRRSKEWSGPHPRSIVPLNHVRTEALKDALIRVGTWVAEHGIDSPESGPGSYRAVRDLLLRLPPRTGQAAGEPLVRDGEAGSDAARRLAAMLDHTTLPIQGPPGSGKTYTGARMIVDLVAAGRKVGVTATSHKVICNLLDEACEAAAEVGVELCAWQKAGKEDASDVAVVTVRPHADQVCEALASGEAKVGAGTPWLWADKDFQDSVDTLFVDEAGQMSLANVVAMGGAARNIVLLGDPQQLDQPLQGVHPPGADRSALAHFLGAEETVDPRRGLFLEHTWRLHPSICDFTSEVFYEDRLFPVERLENQRVVGDDWLAGSGVRWVPVGHAGNTNESVEEAQAVAEIVRSLLGRRFVPRDGLPRPIEWEDIVIVSPYNAHRLLIQGLLGPKARVGTVDKFQGQEAPVSIFSMATSSAEDAPRGMGFLYSLNRLNVATSRARALAIVVSSPALLAARCRTPEQVRMANALCRFVERAQSPRFGAEARTLVA